MEASKSERKTRERVQSGRESQLPHKLAPTHETALAPSPSFSALAED